MMFCQHKHFIKNNDFSFTISRACVDTSETGDLSSATLLGEYSVTYEFTALTKDDQLNFSINVHNEGNTLEIVCMCCKYVF